MKITIQEHEIIRGIMVFKKNNICFVVLNTADAAGNYICRELLEAQKLLNQYKEHKQLFIFMISLLFRGPKAVLIALT